jgi:peptidoglycan/LPS O-acetylase OafA/YrhL
MQYFKQLDSFRFFAAFLVLVAHWLHFLPGLEKFKLGFIGVDFFFVISGFLISAKLLSYQKSVESKQLKQSTVLKSFFIRRTLRIFPIYYLIVIVGTAFNDGLIREALPWNLTYTSNFFFIQQQEWTSLFSHFWSLSVEEHFYLFWPFLILFIRRKYFLLYTGVLILIAFAFRSNAIANHDIMSARIHTLSCLDMFMFGGILAYFRADYKSSFVSFFSKNSVKYSILLGFFLFYAAIVYYHSSTQLVWVYYRLIMAALYAGIIGLLTIGFKGPAGRLFENKWLVLGGALSYAIYVIHSFIPGLLLEMKKLQLPVLMEFLTYFICTVLISYLLHRFFEEPIRKFGDKFKLDKST